MAVLSHDDFMSAVKGLAGDNADDNTLTMIEHVQMIPRIGSQNMNRMITSGEKNTRHDFLTAVQVQTLQQ